MIVLAAPAISSLLRDADIPGAGRALIASPTTSRTINADILALDIFSSPPFVWVFVSSRPTLGALKGKPDELDDKFQTGKYRQAPFRMLLW